jgi:DNA-directed RNA polymerase sigma subunit (sigma70/sigma32)
MEMRFSREKPVGLGVEAREAKTMLDSFIPQHLSKREADIVFGRINGASLQDIGNIHLITRERVRQVYEKAIRKLGLPTTAAKIVSLCD